MHYFEKRNDTSSIVPKDNDVTFNHELHNDYLSKLLRKTIFNKKMIKIISNYALRSFKPNPSIDHD